MLTDEEIESLNPSEFPTCPMDIRFARAIESSVLAKLREQNEPVDLYDTFKAILLKSTKGQLSYYNQDQIDSGCSETANKYSEIAKQLKISLFTHPAPIPEGMALVPKEILDRFPEQNPSNFDYDAAVRLNDWGIELLAAARSGE